MARTLERFLDDLLLKGYGQITISGYYRVLSKIIRELGERPRRKAVEDYALAMRKKSYSHSHLSNTAVALERYMAFMGRPLKLGRTRKPQTLPVKEILTEGEIARILVETKDSREKAMVGTLVYCGCRNKEVCQLKVQDIDLENNLVRVLGGKFNKDRIIPISNEYYKIVLDYLKDYPREKENYLFSTLIGGRQYSGWALRQRIRVVAKRAKIRKRVYPHLLRHSFITHLIERGANIVAVQQLAGHARIETTMQYTHFSPKRIRQEYLFHIPGYQ
jgi:site-specific recombinase XerD